MLLRSKKAAKKSVTFDIISSKVNEQTKLCNREMFVYKKTDGLNNE